jgi:hypothetical protein
MFPGDKSLPEGWKVRSHQWWCQKRNSHRIHYEFLSPQNEFFKSRKAVVEHMTQAGLYTPEQIEMARLQSTPAAAAAALDKNGGGSAGKKKLTPGEGLNALCTTAAAMSSNKLATTASNGMADGDVELATNQLTGWKVGSSTLPVGWKLKRHPCADRTVYFYMSPAGDILKTRRAILDYMWADGGCTEKEFSAVIDGGKERAALLREYYEAKMRGGMQNGGGDVDPDNKDATRSQEDLDLDELDIAEDDDEDTNLVEVTLVKLEDGNRRGAAANRRAAKPEKEPVLPTRRSGRVASKIKRSRLDSNDCGLSDAEEETSLAKRPREADEADLIGNRRKTTTPARGSGRLPSKSDAAAVVDLHCVKQEKDDELKSEVAKEEPAEANVSERRETMEDRSSVMAEDGERLKQEEEEATNGGSVTVSDAMMDFEDTIQCIKKEVQDAKLEEEDSAPIEEAETTSAHPEPNQTLIKTEKHDRPSIVCVSSSSVERSAYNVVVNVLSDLVSTISD